MYVLGNPMLHASVRMEHKPHNSPVFTVNTMSWLSKVSVDLNPVLRRYSRNVRIPAMVTSATVLIMLMPCIQPVNGTSCENSVKCAALT